MKQALVIGAGFAGATVAAGLSRAGVRVTLAEKRDHIGGNMYDEKDISGAFVHRYGPHIFHTDLKNVVDFLSEYTAFFPYEHRVLGHIDNQFVPIPFSLKSLELLFPKEEAAALKEALIGAYGEGKKVPIAKLRESTDENVRKLADYVYEKVFLHYTEKQWGMKPEALGDGVTGRVPVLISYDDRYFADAYQMMPADGYTQIFERMLSHENIELRLSCPAQELLRIEDGALRFLDTSIPADTPVIYTGCLDELFDFCFGELPYRSLNFGFQTLAKERFQNAAVVNYPNEHAYTRITEFKAFTVPTVQTDKTTVVYEYPIAHTKDTIPYYPIPLAENEALYARYQEKAAAVKNLYLVGRLAQYKYLNMDRVIDAALQMVPQILQEMKN